jgi:hypothetical protein
MLSTLKVVQIEVNNWERINLRAKIFSVTSPQEISGRLYRTRRALYLLAAFLGIAFTALATLVINQVVSAPIGLNPSHRNIDNLALPPEQKPAVVDNLDKHTYPHSEEEERFDDD